MLHLLKNSRGFFAAQNFKNVKFSRVLSTAANIVGTQTVISNKSDISANNFKSSCYRTDVHQNIYSQVGTSQVSQLSSSNQVKALNLHGERSSEWWTGKNPSQSTFVDGISTSQPFLTLHDCTRDKLQAYFDNSWTLTEALFACLQGKLSP